MDPEEKRRIDHVRFRRFLRMFGWHAADMADRLKRSRKLFGRGMLAVDPHVHSYYNDALVTVAENREAIKRLGLDFFFATDHEGVAAKNDVSGWSDASWGQEPGLRSHDIIVLCNDEAYTATTDDLGREFEAARSRGRFAFVPHPVGFYFGYFYPKKAVRKLWDIKGDFAIELINGGNHISHGHNKFNDKAVTIWDKLLCEGRRIAAIGGSDAHDTVELGNAWTGVLATRRTVSTIIGALNAGRCFATEAPLVSFTLNGKRMGSSVGLRKGGRLSLKFRAVDSAGIALVRIISRGKVVKEIHARRGPVVSGALERSATGKPTYYRLEAYAVDDRRAYSSPIYID